MFKDSRGRRIHVIQHKHVHESLKGQFVVALNKLALHISHSKPVGGNKLPVHFYCRKKEETLNSCNSSLFSSKAADFGFLFCEYSYVWFVLVDDSSAWSENNKGCYTVVADSDEGAMRVEDVIQSRKDQLRWLFPLNVPNVLPVLIPPFGCFE